MLITDVDSLERCIVVLLSGALYCDPVVRSYRCMDSIAVIYRSVQSDVLMPEVLDALIIPP